MEPLHELKIKITNCRAGHNLPISLIFIREGWMDVAVTEDQGKVRCYYYAYALVYWTGVMKLTRMQLYLRHMRWMTPGNLLNIYGQLSVSQKIMPFHPKGISTASTTFNVPADSNTINVVTKLNYRSFSQHFADHLLGEGKLQVPGWKYNLLSKAIPSQLKWHIDKSFQHILMRRKNVNK